MSYAQWRRDDLACRQAASDQAGTLINRDAYARCMRAAGYRLRAE